MWASCPGALSQKIRMALKQQKAQLEVLFYTARPVSQFYPMTTRICFALTLQTAFLKFAWFSKKQEELMFSFSSPFLLSVTQSHLSLSSTFPLLHAAGWWRDQGEQVLREGGGGDAGVDADHHVLDALIHALPPPFCEHAASWSKYGSLNSQASLVLKLFQLLNCPRRSFPYRAHIFPFIEKLRIPSNLT